jgi:hypothetical protein
MIEIFQGSEFSFPIEILNYDGSGKVLTEFTIKAGIRFQGETILIKECAIEDVGLISLPLLPEDTAVIGIYVVEIRLEKTGYNEPWGQFSYEIIESIILQGS